MCRIMTCKATFCRKKNTERFCYIPYIIKKHATDAVQNIHETHYRKTLSLLLWLRSLWLESDTHAYIHTHTYQWHHE